MTGKPVKKSVGRDLRRCLWELLTPTAASYSQPIHSFAHMDTGAFSQQARQYHAWLCDLAITVTTYAWHQTMHQNVVYRTALPKGLNRAERFLAMQLLEFGHQVASNVLDRLREGHEHAS